MLSIALGVPMMRRRPIAAYVRQAFASGEQGAWYDPSDMSTLFQDAAGTTPVTAVEQPVGLMLDKSGRGNHAVQSTTTKRPVLSRRVNLLVASENLLAAEWALISGAVKVTGSRLQFAGNNSQAYQNVVMAPTVGTTYRFEAVLSGAGTMSMVISFPGGVYEEWVQPITLSATPTLFVMDRTIAQAGHTACNFSLSKGTGSATEVTAHQTSLRIATDAHLPYQRVNTATDYDADPAKFPAYLRFDGVDDAMQTGNIDFTGTDKMTVWAGLTSLSNSAAQTIAELSADINTATGAFWLARNYDSGARSNVLGSRGTATALIVPPAPDAPDSYVITGGASIAGNALSLRRNSVAGGTIIGNQGSGNYGNYPLFIGARNQSGLYFNGRLYSLIVRGAQSSLSQIEATELYIKQKMRMP